MPIGEYMISEEQAIHIRFATKADAPIAVKYMHKLGEFQKMRDSILITPEQMAHIIEKGDGEVIFAEYKGEIKAFAFFCKHVSAFIGQYVLYIDALYVDEELRGKGAGKIMMQFLAKLCMERKYGRMEWACLDWNTPAWDFYVNMGANPIETLTLLRLDQTSIENLARA